MSKILAIESSCDETGATIFRFTSSVKEPMAVALSSQIKIHTSTSGVVPEVAARAHLQKIKPIVEAVLNKSKVRISELNAIAVTTGPGLIISLLVGVEFAKGLAFAAQKPIIAVNHMQGHLYSPLLAEPRLKFPCINLIVSGGHTHLVLMKNKKDFKVLGSTVDDAVGEAFDKVAKMLGLPYPGGPAVSRAAEKGKTDYIFPRPMINSGDFNFSFAGLKTAVLYKIRDQKLNTRNPQTQADISMSYQNAAVDVLTVKTLRAAKKFHAKSIALSGGVAANRMLRESLNKIAKQNHLQFAVPPFELCTDNAVMIANAAAIMINNGYKPKKYSEVKVDPGLDL